ncbi:hypothetical protein V495_03267 [Pseudogymnoascus sp. VKM F-4514 (FW-929)]|nr:hypothetical protein V495_03267 [Pseudogymnoascus sp. VKM F-4514 (FW-929)]KFY60974.1 hypothetical protein V497_03204 [Pseudogymnoascus sp. VKM F-4516 (FW-969)]
MGIPAAFKWLSTKYPKILSPVIEDHPKDIDNVTIPVDATQPNPNGEEFDNLYLDMNGIVHPCSHPEDRPPPANEEEMMLEIFKYTERVFNMVRPRKLLMIAVDGVAPRAKMNQQRSRRFRSAQEAKEKDEDKAELLKMLRSQAGGQVEESTSEAMVTKTWDSNAITPGTPFMDILAASLRYWTAYKLNTDPAWAKVKVILSDATVPGEGEHKIMQFIRSQRSSPDHDPNTRHVIYGLDADLIMLGLATHEPHFRVLREDVFFQDSKARTCRLCNQKGHEARECRGQAKEKDGEFDEKDTVQPLKPFIWLHVSVLREYLEAELYVPNQPFRFDLERAIDDWVFMCFFVGNDFLPHLPSLEIRENGIDTLMAIWRDNIPQMGGYVTKDGHVDLERAQFILDGLAKQEDAIFRRRRQTEERRDANAKRRKLQEQNNGRGRNDAPRFPGRPTNVSNAPIDFPLIVPGNVTSSISKEARSITHDMVVNRGAIDKANMANKSAAAALKSQLTGAKGPSDDTSSAPPVVETVASAFENNILAGSPISALGKRKADLIEDEGSNTPTPTTDTSEPATPSAPVDEAAVDNVRLWEDGYADRYYEQKFKVDPRDVEFRHKVAKAYVEGLAWVLLYYFQGCPSWEWYYPYHYAPFAADFTGLADMKISFEKGRIFKPFEQLMGVMPAASRHTIPDVFHDLMTNEDSEIIEFYPPDFPIDLNGKKFAWQGVALLPFIDAKRLLSAMEQRYPLLPPEVAARNTVGNDVLLVSEAHQSLYDDIATHFYSKKQGSPQYQLNPRISDGLAGKVEKNDVYLPHGSLTYPLEGNSMPSLDEDRSISVHYDMPRSAHVHKSMLLRGVKFPTPALNQEDIQATKGRAANAGRNPGGYSQRGGYGGRGRGGGSQNYGNHSSNSYPRQQQSSSRQAYGNQPAYNQYPAPPQGWQPPPPGVGGFTRNPPPPPPGMQGSYAPGRPSQGGPPQYGSQYPQFASLVELSLIVAPATHCTRPVTDVKTEPTVWLFKGHELYYTDDRVPHGCEWRSKPGRFVGGSPGYSSPSSDWIQLSRPAERRPIAESLVLLLEELTAQYKDLDTHPPHVVNSELYIIHILADCFSAHWDAVNRVTNYEATNADQRSILRGAPPAPQSDSDREDNHNDTDEAESTQETVTKRLVLPKPLDDILAGRVLEAVKIFLAPYPEQYTLPASTILEYSNCRLAQTLPHRPDNSDSENNSYKKGSGLYSTDGTLQDIESHARTIIEFLSASNWELFFEHLKTSFRLLQVVFPLQGNGTQAAPVLDDDRNALATLRIVAFIWVDKRKLSLVLSELCGCFFHLRKTFQSTLGLALPILILRWVEQNPEEFVQMHNSHSKIDGVDRLFDIANGMVDSNRWKAVLYPFQIFLLFLIPDVFEVATSMPSTGRYLENSSLPKSSSGIFKKVSFLESLRKALRNKNPAAAYCLISLLRIARHFSLEGNDSALLSYALDVQEEVRDALFRKNIIGNEGVIFDNGLMTAAFVSLTHLNFESCNENIAPQCVSSNAPNDFKLAFVSACSNLAKLPSADLYSELFEKITALIRDHLKDHFLGSDTYHSHEPYGASKSSSSSTEMTYRCLDFLNVLPLTLFGRAPTSLAEYEVFFQENFAILVGCLVDEDPKVRRMASSVTRKLLKNGSVFLLHKGASKDSEGFPANFWKSTSAVLLGVLEHAAKLSRRGDSVLSFIHDFVESRVELIRSAKDDLISQAETPQRLASLSKLETYFLVRLCSADIEICQMVTVCVGLLCEEAQMVDAAYDSSKSPSTIMRNIEVYQDLSSRDFHFTGLVAFQKRLRSLLRQMKHPSAAVLNAWEIVFGRWYDLSKRASAHRQDEILDERSLVEWRNCSGFLASLAALCISKQTSSVIEESGLAGLKWIDRPSQDSYDNTLLDRYMTQSVQLLACNNARIREAMREVLSTEISPSLYLPLFKTLESELETLFDGPIDTANRFSDSRIAFAEQAAALLKTIIERLGSPADMGAALSVDIGALTLNFARFLNSVSEGLHTLRIKIKVCQLCEVVTRKKELLNLRHDVRIRNQLLEIMFGWIARPGSPKADNAAMVDGVHRDDALKLQRDLDKACLKALSDLTFRLPLQPPDGQTDADTSDLKSEMFHTYFNRFLSLLGFEPADQGKNDVASNLSAKEDSLSIRELAIIALSNLLGANIDVGLKHSLGIGYHEDLEIRTAFVTVLCNVLAQGTEFNNLSDVAVGEKYDELVEVLVSDMTLTIALCDACPSNEVDELTMSLLNIFDSRGLGFVLLEELIKHEVDNTENEAELLRRNCVTTKMLSVYARWKGSSYLKSTLQKVLERLIVTAQDLDLELDPSRTSSPEELQRNTLQLRVVAKVFIDDICSSAPNIPISFRNICSIISSSVMARFPDAKFTAVGAFIFLRFFCPAIVAPDVEGLISTAPSKEMRRGLLLIAKIIQNLANNVLFGAKESYMFPLNDFLTQNIYEVTAFLRAISVAPHVETTSIEMESFDFGSCVALHRFFYDHWDHVRQKLVAQQRKDSLHSPHEIAQGRLPVAEALRSLISNLGPPPMDISWNRPMISMNSPPSYSRFQHFMLRHAGRSTESAISTRTDGLSMICIILRNIDAEANDYDLLLYCYLKIASRMWHRPFGIMIDATCYSGQNEPQDALLKKLDLLTPTELSKNLACVYVYNMNSAFRKCFRRILRLSAKNDNSAFHPKNVDYHLIGSLQDLQTHFHLSQLHLPKETISVVTDTRFVFQPVTRLSKTKGKIEVMIQVGSQFVQVTTTKKQEIVPGLRLHATVNDIFRLTEVDEAPTSIQTEDDSAFGLRADSGKIVMYFTSPRKSDVLQAIRGAKIKYSKDLKPSQPFERLIRPQDIPGTLLNISFTNLASLDQNLRIASYNLLCALCQTFKFGVNSSFMASKELSIPPSASHFIVNVSRQLAASEPQLTADFMNEFFVGWESFPLQQRPLSLAYLSPWLSGLRSQVLAIEIDGEKARERIASIFRKLIDVAVPDSTLSITLEQIIWPVICEDEVLTDILVDEIIKSALTSSSSESRISRLGSIIASLQVVTVRGKLISRLRKALNRTSLRPTRLLPENSVWDEICVLLRLCLAASFNSGVQAHLYLPEISHIITMLANTGSAQIRLVVHGLLVNTVHILCTCFSTDESKLVRLKAILASLSDPNTGHQANLSGVTREGTTISHAQDPTWQILSSTEALAILLSEVSSLAAPSVDLSNSWRSRWMSLVASTAFQSNPAIQPRAFAVMGCLAREDVDDDLLYQVLVALRKSVNRFADENDNEMLVSIVTSLTKMMEKLPTTSRYGLQLFWLAMALVRLVPLNLFSCAASFLEAVLININTSGDLKGGRMVPVLLQGRLALEDSASQLDESYGIHFNIDNFHFAVCASLVKGLTDTVTKATTVKVLSTFLEIASSSALGGRRFPDDLSCLPYLGLVMSRALTTEEAKGNLWLAGINGDKSSTPEDVLAMINLDTIKDKELLLNTAISLVDFRYLEDSVQNRGLIWMNKVAIIRPTVILHLSGPILSILDEVLLSSQNSVTLQSAQMLLRTLTTNPKLSDTVDTAQLLEDVLEDIGFGGLWVSSTFHSSTERDGHCTVLTDKLIELIIT